jgi:serine/threonine-protein kinase
MSTDLRVGNLLGGYRLESPLGRGGMSVVYMAEDTKLGRKVALKVMAEELSENDAFRSRFIREAQMAANLEHPNIVPVYDAGEINGVLYLSMRIIRGTDLRRVITEGGPLETRRTLTILRQVASALDAAHQAGLVHRDVKPANILLAMHGGDEHAYLTDFGLTKHVSSKSGLTKTGQFMGTIDYVAPEQIRGTEVDGRTDVYSLGCVLYECLTGQLPFIKDQDVAILFAHLEDTPPRISEKRGDLSPALDDVIARAMQKEKDDRFETCMAFAEAVRHALNLTPAAGTPAFEGPAPTVFAPPPSQDAPRPEQVLEPHPSFPPADEPSIRPAAAESAEVGEATSPPAADIAGVVGEAQATSPPAAEIAEVVEEPQPTSPPEQAAAFEVPGPPAEVVSTTPSERVPGPPPTVVQERRAGAGAPDTRRRTLVIVAIVAALAIVGAVAAFALVGGGEEPVEAAPKAAETEASSPSPSTTVKVDTPPEVRAPLGLRAPAPSVTVSSVTLRWEAAPNGGEPVRFLVFRDDEQIGKTTETRFIDDQVDPSTTYVYRVVAVGSDGSEARSKPLRISTPAPAPPPAPPSSGGGGGDGCDGITLDDGSCLPFG